MGIFGALQSAVSGLKSQSHAMENISGNIANSQTIGYKRIDTSFVDMIADAPVKSQVAGATSAYSRSMNTLRGDIQNADTETYMALNGNGFFVVQPADGSSGTFYTRRGDFDIDRDGFLVNGAGYRLTGLTMDNGVVTGSVAQPIQVDNSFLPAKRSTTINYQLNLPQVPKTSSYVATTPNSELFRPWGYSTVQGTPAFPNTTGATLPTNVPARATGVEVAGTTLANTLVEHGDQLNITVDGTTYNVTFTTNGTATSAAGTAISINAQTGTMASVLADLQTQLQNNVTPAVPGMTVGLKNGAVAVSLPAASTDPLSFTTNRAGTMTGAVFGLSAASANINGAAVTSANMPADLMVQSGQVLSFNIGGVVRNYLIDTNGTQTAAPGQTRIAAGGSVADMLAAIQADLRSNGGADASSVTLNVTGNQVNMSFDGNYRSDVTVTGTATGLGINGAFNAETGNVNGIAPGDSDKFIAESIAGGGLTLYSNTGEPVNVQMRWAKLTNDTGAETWGLFYASDSRAGATQAWTKVANYTYDQGVLASITPVAGVSTASGTEQLNISNLSVNGTALGQISLDHGLKGMTQFADNTGAATTTALKQNGYGAGEFISVGISDDGRVVASYTNGETREVAQVITASFNNANALKRGDGGVYTATTESGEPIVNQNGEGIVGGSTESSNTDISEEFTKLIVTQQAYSANTRIVTAADEMLQEALSMIR